MTHITQEQARELAESAVMIRDGYWQSDLLKLTEVCNAAIQTYLDSLSAELPEPDYIYKHEDIYGNEVGPPELFYSASTVRALLEAQDAKWQEYADRLISSPGD